jgi:SOS response regulatory protein OraA/RecX
MEKREKLEETIREYGYSLLKRRDYTVHDFLEKLKKKFLWKESIISENLIVLEEKEELIQKIIFLFQEREYLSDRNFAKSYISAHHYGRKKLLLKLREKGISQSIIEDLLVENQKNELQKIRKILEKQKGKNSKKIIESLLRKGFCYEDIQRIISEET